MLLVHTVPTAGYPFSVLSNSAAGEQIRVAVRLGYRLANSDLAPAWNPGEAFAQARQSLPN